MEPGSDDNLFGDLTTLFLVASKAAKERMESLGQPLTFTTEATSVERDRTNPDAWSSESREIQQNTLAHPNVPPYQIAPLLTPEVVDAARGCAAKLVEASETNLPFWAPFRGNVQLLVTERPEAGEADYAADPTEWTLWYLVLPALQRHLVALPSLDAANEDTGRAFADDVWQVATADHLAYRVTVPLAGIDIDDAHEALAVGDVTLRRLDAEEQGRLLEDWGIVRPGLVEFRALPLVALEMLVSTPRDQQNPDVRDLIAKWLCALQLHGYSIAGYYALFETAPPWVMPISMRNPLTLPLRPRAWSTISAATLREVGATVARLDRYHVSEPSSEHDLALHRFYLGAGRASSVDAVLDFTIALESLLLPYDEIARHSELGYRFRTHGAHYLAASAAERRTVARQLSDLYGLRSRLVHGSNYPAGAEIETQRILAEEFARRGLQQAVSGSFPTAVQFRDMLLGI